MLTRKCVCGADAQSTVDVVSCRYEWVVGMSERKHEVAKVQKKFC